MEAFEAALTGGHPNSLGRTVDVVEAVLRDRSRLEELFACYGSQDAVVRLRTSSAVKRVEAERHEWVVPFIDRLIDEVGPLDQASAQWTLAQLFQRMADDMSDQQRSRALAVMKRNLAEHDDWIVLGTHIDALADWSRADGDLRGWLRPHLVRLSGDPRKSVAMRAVRRLTELSDSARASKGDVPVPVEV